MSAVRAPFPKLAAALTIVVALVAAVPALGGEDRTRWVNGTLADALSNATESKKLALVYCWEQDAPKSVTFYETTMKADEVMTAMEAYVCFSAKKGRPEGDEVINQYTVAALPAVLFLEADGTLVDVVGGAIPKAAFVKDLARVLRGEDTLRELILRSEEPFGAENAGARFQLAMRYRGLGETTKAAAQFDALRKADAKGATLPGARAHLLAAMEDAAGSAALDPAWDGERLTFDGARKEWSTKPLYAWAKKVKADGGAFEAWDALAEVEIAQGNKDAALAAWQKAYDDVPDDRLLEWCSALSRRVMELGGRRPTSQKKFALRLATHCAKVADDLDEGSDGYRAAFGDTKKDVLVARYTEPLAWALRYNSQHGQAMTTIDKCIELDPNNEQLQKTRETLLSGSWPPPPGEDG